MSPLIKHVVVLMLENRSYDHMLGYLQISGAEGVPLDASNPSDLGWGGHASASIIAREGGDFVTNPDPGHEFDDVTFQLFAQHNIPAISTPTNNGFVMSYCAAKGPNGLPVGLGIGQRIMHCFSPSQLPVLSTLAKNYTLCDHWFSSVPGPTWPNRFFAHAATSNGHIDSPAGLEAVKDELGFSTYGMHTIFESLEKAEHTWNIYYHDFPQSLALTNLHRRMDQFVDISQFHNDAHTGKLPSYSFIEPRYFDIPLEEPANDMHPPHDVREGERLVATVYDTLTNSGVWENTLMVVLFDEHGGYYDHVPPPACINPDGRVATNGFAFDRLGVRVPALLISPRIPRGVDNRVFDHTSLLATIKKLFNLPSFLTKRDASASTFENLILDNTRDVDRLPSNLSQLLGPSQKNPADAGRTQLSDHQRSLMQLARSLNDANHTESTAIAHITDELNRFRKYRDKR